MCGDDIELIKNVTLATNINQNGIANRFTFNIPNLPSFIDEVVVKSISYYGAISGCYYIWSDLNNDYIGTVISTTGNQITPNTKIKLNGIAPANITVAVRELGVSNEYVASPDAAILTIQLEFIRYLRD